MLTVHMIGQAHIDPVWLWPWQAGVDEAVASLRSAADRLDEYPEFKYTGSDAWLYLQVEQIDPELFDRIREFVRQGRWELVGGAWMQPYLELPTGEGLRQQFVHGMLYFRERFGVESTIGFNPDGFGHPNTLPDILAPLGFDGYVFHRGQPIDRELEHHTFRWRGPNRGEVIAHRLNPVYVTRTDDLWGQITLATELCDPHLGHTTCFYGVGNHGGGPTKGNIEYILENAEAFDGVRLRFSTLREFFDEIKKRHDDLPVEVCELEHTFPGCYSVMHDIKQEQRYVEHELERAARVMQAFGHESEQAWAIEKLERAWKDMLFVQFHDALGGTCSPPAWKGVKAMQGRARIECEEVTCYATRRWAKRSLPGHDFQQIVILNPDDEPFDDYIEVEPNLDFAAWGKRWISDAEGRLVEFQQVQPMSREVPMARLLIPAHIPPRSAGTWLVRDDPLPSPLPMGANMPHARSDGLFNDRVEIRCDDDGIAAIHLDGQPAIGRIGLHLREDTADTWGFHTDRFDDPILERFETRWEVEEQGPLRARLRAEGHLRFSKIRWTISLQRDEPIVHFDLEVQYAEEHKLLQMPMELIEPCDEWMAGMPGGAVTRPASAVETPLCSFGCIQPRSGPPFALVTADAYSSSMRGQEWIWTLLRSPIMAWGGRNITLDVGRDWHTDQGAHPFHFTLLLDGPLEEHGLHLAARRQAQPPILLDRYEGLDRPAYRDQPPQALWNDAVQRAIREGRLPHLAEKEALLAESEPPKPPVWRRDR